MFVCNLCNEDHGEFVHRIDVRWVDVVHLAMFNLTLHDVRTYFDYDAAITHWISNNWEHLQAPLEVSYCWSRRESAVIDVEMRNICHEARRICVMKRCVFVS